MTFYYSFLLFHRRIRGEGNLFSAKASIVVLLMSRFLCTHWTDCNGTWHQYSSCEWALLKSFSRSEVRGTQSECCNGGVMHFDGVASRLTCLFSNNFIQLDLRNLKHYF